MNQKPYLGIPSIDSLKLAFDIKDVDILNSSLLDHKIKAVINQSTGEIESETTIQSNSLAHQYDSYVIHFAIHKLIGKEYAVILLNSKLLEANYMDGISMNNIEAIYNKLMDAKVFHISFMDFLSKGRWSDADIKKDVEVESLKAFDLATKELDKATKPQAQKDRGCSRFAKPFNKGIEFNSRTKSTYKHPFLKVYHKGLESRHSKNSEYFLKHINIESITNVVRVEATIKDWSTQGSKYGIKDNTLDSLLRTTKIQLNEVLSHCLNTNMNERIERTPRKTLREYTPMELVLYSALVREVKNGMDIDIYIQYLIEELPHRSKVRTKKKLRLIYDSEIKTREFAKVNRITNDLLSSIGWG